jgi:heparosan-N-sulfate-glucuronate 5-epimerase
MPASRRRLPRRLRRAARELSAAHAAISGRTVEFTHQPLGSHIDPKGLGGYYCDLRHKAAHTIDGLPLGRGGKPDVEVIPVAQTALGFWELRIEGHDVDDAFLRLADWLMERAEPASDDIAGLVWRIQVRMPKYELMPGWASAMAQGQVASVLLRAHSLTGDSEYLGAAHAAFPPLTVAVADGGLQATIDGAVVLEEYPTVAPSAVLNGWIFALFGVHELAVAGELAEARDLFELSAGSLVTLLPSYDVGWWSLYSLGDHGRPDLAKPFYQRLHPVLLEALALIHPDPALRAYAQRWTAQLTKPNTARASVNKLAFRAYRALAEREGSARSAG